MVVWGDDGVITLAGDFSGTNHANDFLLPLKALKQRLYFKLVRNPAFFPKDGIMKAPGH